MRERVSRLPKMATAFYILNNPTEVIPPSVVAWRSYLRRVNTMESS